MFKYMVGAVLWLVCAVSAYANPVWRVAPCSIAEGGWITFAIVDSSVQSQPVTAIIAFPPENAVWGNNLTGVWYTYDDATGAWGAKAWSAPRAQIVRDLKGEYSLPDIDDVYWGMSTITINEAAFPLEAKDFVNGLFVDDPFYAAISESADADTIVEWLVESGYPAANLPFEKFAADTACARAYTFDGLALEYSKLSTGSSHEDAFAAKVGLRSAHSCYGVVDWFLNLICTSVTYGSWSPIAGTTRVCPATWSQGTFDNAGVELSFPGLSVTYSPLYTCFYRTCEEQWTRTVTFSDWCMGTSVSYTENRIHYLTEVCCVAGVATLTPAGLPPCSPTAIHTGEGPQLP